MNGFLEFLGSLLRGYGTHPLEEASQSRRHLFDRLIVALFKVLFNLRNFAEHAESSNAHDAYSFMELGHGFANVLSLHCVDNGLQGLWVAIKPFGSIIVFGRSYL